MLISRGVNILKLATGIRKIPNSITNGQPVRMSHGTILYRQAPTPDKTEIFWAEVLGGFMWWWVFWHLYHQSSHITGEYPYPDVSKWTDEELGIPPDDSD